MRDPFAHEGTRANPIPSLQIDCKLMNLNAQDFSDTFVTVFLNGNRFASGPDSKYGPAPLY